MFKGVIIGVGVILVLAVIPVVHFIGVPFGPFIAGYFGINAVRESPVSPGRRALTMGAWMGAVVGVSTFVAALIVTIIGDFAYPVLMWGGVVVITFYYTSMTALGAWYCLLRAAERSSAAEGPTVAAKPPRPVSGASS